VQPPRGFGVSPDAISIMGDLIALIGLGISLYSESPIDIVGGPVVGRIDEIVSAGFLGFAVGAAIKENAT